ncbi:hypothetical protein [Ralstonia sp. SET104]|uniref:hypothetical protein n=1 Tax=Ralstonia sp. SET104 TaxID=2448774 RepID=UPI000F58C64C|nr:hypothetical protein [Ralstonia sp. SET104]GCB06726.1 hypothetical protein PSUB009319_43570 [Ralstonia sp. SET104]
MRASILTPLILAGMLGGCGGGGDATTSVSSASGGAIAIATQQPANPYTGQAAPGTTTTAVTGQVFNSGATVGATVTAYLLNPDGSNGAQIGTATSGTDGLFTMTLTQAPYATASYVRFVATGGSYTSSADHTIQSNDTLELVTPYVTTAFDNFILTPLTHVASARMTQVVSTGGSLPSAYTAGASMVLSLIGFTDSILPNGHSTAGIDYLAVVPGSAGDPLNAYADALNAVEAYGVKYDLPSFTSVRLLAQSQLTGTASATLPNGTQINIGQWQNGIFNPVAPYTLASLQSAGAPPPYAQMHQFIVWEYIDADCRSGNNAAYYTRFPLQQGQPNLFTSGQCPTFQSYVSHLDAKVSTNNRSRQLVTSSGYVPQNVPVVGAGS